MNEMHTLFTVNLPFASALVFFFITQGALETILG